MMKMMHLEIFYTLSLPEACDSPDYEALLMDIEFTIQSGKFQGGTSSAKLAKFNCFHSLFVFTILQ